MADPGGAAFPSDARFEQDLQALAARWLDLNQDEAALQQANDALLAEAQQRGETRLAPMSLACQALRLATFRRLQSQAQAQVTHLLGQLRQPGVPARALRLAEAAWGHSQVYVPAQHAAAIDLLTAQGPAEDDPRPAAERFWTEVALAALLAANGRFDEALQRGLLAEQLAAASGVALLQVQAAQTLGYLFLSVGDVDGACLVLPPGITGAERCGMQPETLYYNLLLALWLDRRAAEALRLLEQNPWLEAAERQQRVPSLRALAGLLRHEAGQALPTPIGPADAALPGGTAEAPAMVVNRVWMAATVMLAQGQVEAAGQAVTAALAWASASVDRLSPMNGAQLLRLHGAILEAQGDLRGALAAYKASQAHCYTWVGQSVRSRLQALHFLADDPPDREVQARRLQAVQHAVADARQAPAEAAEPSRFLAHVTHEMRNPLNGVLGMTSLLMMSELDQRQRRYVSLAHSAAQMLLALCNDVLDLAKIESGRFELNPQPLNLSELLTRASQLLEPQASVKGLRWTRQLDPTLPPSLLGDGLRLQQVVMNLLSNALKFTTRGEVALRATWRADAAGGGWLHVAVQDTGPGLSEAVQARLFQEFVQADAGVAQAHGGTGLGLALCKRLVELMQGRIGLQSQPGQGSQFWFEVPLAGQPAEQPAALATGR